MLFKPRFLFPVLVVLTFIFLNTSLASAFRLLPEPPGHEVTAIPDIGASYAAFRQLTSPNSVDVYEFSAKKSQLICIQVTVPAIPRYKTYSPYIVVVRADAPSAPWGVAALEKGRSAVASLSAVNTVLGAMPNGRLLAKGEVPVALSVAYDGSAETVFEEKVTGTKYYIRQTITVSAPDDGTYRIGVYSGDNLFGKYVLAPGKVDKWNLTEVISLPTVRMRVRTFCEMTASQDMLVFALVGVALGLGLFSLLKQ